MNKNHFKKLKSEKHAFAFKLCNVDSPGGAHYQKHHTIGLTPTCTYELRIKNHHTIISFFPTPKHTFELTVIFIRQQYHFTQSQFDICIPLQTHLLYMFFVFYFLNWYKGYAAFVRLLGIRTPPPTRGLKKLFFA